MIFEYLSWGHYYMHSLTLKKSIDCLQLVQLFDEGPVQFSQVMLHY